MVNRRLMATVVEEQTALLSSEKAWEAPDDGTKITPGTEVSNESSEIVCTLCAPIVRDGEAIGVIIASKKEAYFYSLRDLGLLQAVDSY